MIYLLIILYAIFNGIDNGILYSREGADATKWNEHIIFVIQRCLVCAVAFAGVQHTYTSTLIQVIAGALAFSFFHNGMYYITRFYIYRGVLNPYDAIEQFFYDSTSSTAKIELKDWQRTILFALSVLCLGLNLFIK